MEPHGSASAFSKDEHGFTSSLESIIEDAFAPLEPIEIMELRPITDSLRIGSNSTTSLPPVAPPRVPPRTIPYYMQVFDQAGITEDVERWSFEGSGTESDPYIVLWIPNDPRNPREYSMTKKVMIMLIASFSTLLVTLLSGVYAGGRIGLSKEFHIGEEVFTLGISLFVLGFAVGPLLLAPISELFGRQILYACTCGMLTLLVMAAALSPNITSLIVFRALAGAIGSSPLTSAPGVIADLFEADQRGPAMSLFAAAPFLGPVIGPIIGGFIGDSLGWRWIEGIMAIFIGFLWLLGLIAMPETYAPVLQRRRAEKLSKMTGKLYRSRGDIDGGRPTFKEIFATSLSRPWILLFREPIVMLLSIYTAIVYGSLYMQLGAFPIVYQRERGWSPGVGGLAFLGMAVGCLSGIAYSLWDNKRYKRVTIRSHGRAPPEARLPIVMIGGILVPVAFFWFAWTNSPNIHYLASIAAGVPMAAGMAMVFMGVVNYLVDSYVIFASSVLAASGVMRALFGAAFPLFADQMYSSLGIHWASSIPAFLALVCVPFPFLFHRYGESIRLKCKYAREAEEAVRRIQAKQV